MTFEEFVDARLAAPVRYAAQDRDPATGHARQTLVQSNVPGRTRTVTYTSPDDRPLPRADRIHAAESITMSDGFATDWLTG